MGRTVWNIADAHTIIVRSMEFRNNVASMLFRNVEIIIELLSYRSMII